MKPLSWNEITVRARGFAEEWEGETYEKGETHSFYDGFFDVFGVKRRSVARYEEYVKKRFDERWGFIDVFWPGVLIVEQKSAGKDLQEAYEQAGDYFDALSEDEKPRYILVCDFQTFELYDLDERSKAAFDLTDLPSQVARFAFIRDEQPLGPVDQDPVSVKAAELMGGLHDDLRESGYTGHDLERYLVRLAFCLFADDTGIFDPPSLFLSLIENRTSVDGSDLGGWLGHLFQVLDTPTEKRSALLDEDLDRFPYINGDLFEETLPVPSFDAGMRERLLEACRFDWSDISPAIFGALFQWVMHPKQRRTEGAHYTTEENILKVSGPLFMDDLRARFDRLKERRDSSRRVELQRFQRELGRLRFFDPACGCGNFLVVAYRELRLLEMEILREITRGQRALDIRLGSEVDVHQFYGIEKSEFPARIAETALWMMDHIMNNQLSQEFGQTFARIPLERSPRIVPGDALEIDWAEVLAPAECTVVFSNPPYGGAKIQSSQQREQVKRVMKAAGGSGGTLDYVTAWFVKAGEYLQSNPSIRIGYVATNSITQGQQVAHLWPVLFDRYRMEISFAHRTFAWGSEVRGKAQVHVVIVGLDHRSQVPPKKRLFDYEDVKSDPVETQVSAISPYLIDAGHLHNPQITVREAKQPINGMGQLRMGSQPIDDGNYIIRTPEERKEFLQAEPTAEPFLRPYIGAQEFLHGGKRWILALHDATPAQLSRMPHVRERIARVRAYRQASTRARTRMLADTPAVYDNNVLPTKPFLVIPEVSSERRQYIPIGWLEPPAVPSNLVRVFVNATLSDFALLTSRMHMAWAKLVGGRLESRYRYSIGVIYNTFPVPPAYQAPETQAKLEPLAQQVLNARSRWPDSTLAQLYTPDLMPADLRRAHRTIDRAVDRLYRPEPFGTEAQRVRHLLERYDQTLYAP